MGVQMKVPRWLYCTRVNNWPKKLKRIIYVDNLVTGADSKPEAMSLYRNVKSLFNKAAKNLPDWPSNDQYVNPRGQIWPCPDGRRRV